MYDTAHSIRASGGRERLAMCSGRVLYLKRPRKWEKIYKLTLFKGIATVCHVLTEKKECN